MHVLNIRIILYFRDFYNNNIFCEIYTCIICLYLLKYLCCESDKTLISLGGATMAKCAICEKSAHFGNNVSHSNRKSNRSWNVNVQKVKIEINGKESSQYVCTRCLRTANKNVD